MPKILIAVPCMDMVATQFCSSLATLNKGGECSVGFQIGSLIYDSRNKLAQQAVEGDYDYVLWLDSDMVFTPDLLEKLLECDKDIVSGLYFHRVYPFTPVLFDKLELDGDIIKDEKTIEYPNKIFEIDGCGFGAVLMRTEVLMDVVGKFGNWFSPFGNVGEDLAFCWRAKQCGYKIYCDPTIKLGHIGHSVITEDFFKTYQGEKK